jgi:hypothetical protein
MSLFLVYQGDFNARSSDKPRLQLKCGLFNKTGKTHLHLHFLVDGCQNCLQKILQIIPAVV